MQNRLRHSIYLFLSLALLTYMSSILVKAQSLPSPQARKSYSVLASGPSLKVSVTGNNVYKVTYEQLSEHGLLNQAISSDKIAIWGNQSGYLPFFNTSNIYDDLQHLPIQIEDGGDGMFGSGDYILFYGENQHRWTYDPESNSFTHTRNPFSDKTYYFVGINSEWLSRVSTSANQPSSDISITTSNEHIRYEKDMENPCAGGTQWLGERFSFSNDKISVSLETPDPAQSSADLSIQTASQVNGGATSFTIGCNGQSFQITHNYSNNSCTDIKNKTQEIGINGSTTSIEIKYTKTSVAGNGYLDWIDLFYQRQLHLQNGSICFRNTGSIGKSASYTVTGTSSSTEVWNVTDIYQIYRLPASFSSGTIRFTDKASDTLQEYIAFNPSECPSPTFEGIVSSQNLHSVKNVNYIIVSYPDFLEQAQTLARYHQERNGHRCLVTTTSQVYNEFSSGAKDPSAIRMLLKCIRDNSDEGQGPESLLLFGAASYDYKDILGSISDFVPTLQAFRNDSESGGDPLEDNFAYLDANEGISPTNYQKQGDLDIAVGRLPVRTKEEADNAVEKIEIYTSPTYRYDPHTPNNSGNFGHWRNGIVYVSDDGFESSMENFIVENNLVQDSFPDFHLVKLYSDAYERNSTATSTRVDALSDAIRNQIEGGCIFLGYLGHSAWNAWADEKILTTDIINNLSKSYTFPVVLASSCSFGHFDNINQVSGAELLVTRKQAGSIATIATARTAYTGSIEELFKRVAENIASTKSGEQPTLGEIYLKAKNANRQSNGHRFVLLGDPGVRLAIAQHQVVTTKINGKDANNGDIDTLKALRPIHIEGEIRDHSGKRIEDFNGTLSVRIYDKATEKSTMGLYNPIDLGGSDNPYNPVVKYTDQSSLIFQGSSEVKEGKYNFSFIVPKDIAYNFGKGRINYYAYTDNSDAKGSFENLTVGGFYEDAVIDTSAPIVKLYINNNSYIKGTVGKNPSLYAEISDRNGINTTGAGIGHDMTLTIDNDRNNTISVNNMFRYNLGSYKEGTLSYPLELEPGRHTLSLKVWNIHNISTTASIEFNVDGSENIQMFDLRAVPNPNRGEYVDFYFNHNGMQGDIEECQLRIFNLQGMLIGQKTYSLTNSNGYSVGPLRWDMRSLGGSKVQSGIYICHLYLKTSDGANTHKVCKVVVTRP